MVDISLDDYRTLIFDCDGVVLNSNKIKTAAFYEVTKHYGHDVATAFVGYHVQNGGVSRYEKFEYFINKLLKKKPDQEELDSLLMNFARVVKRELMTCEVAEGLMELREKTQHTRWLIVSGGDENELREIFEKRGLATLFDGGIFGSPNNKETILKREEDRGNIVRKGLFLGDSQYDYQAAKQAKHDFVYVSAWSEWVPAKQPFMSINKLHKLIQ